jgi:hypothetical protein
MLGIESFPELNKFKVLELDNHIPISFYGKILKDFNAEVTLIKSIDEKKDKKPKLSHRLNRGKKIIYLNLKKKGQHLTSFINLIEKSDILLDNKINGFLERNQIEINLIKKHNPKLIMVFIEGNKIINLEKGKEKDKDKEINKINNNINYNYNYHLEERDISYINSLKRILKFYRNKDYDNKKFIDPMIIISDLFDGTVLSLSELSKSLMDRIRSGKGSIISTEINVNLNSLSILSEKMTDKNTFSFSCYTKDFDYILFSIDHLHEVHKFEDMNIFLKKICERLYIEVLNYNEISEVLRLDLMREYIDYFQLITKNINDSIKHIRDLCKLMDKEEIIRQLKRFEFLDLHLVKHNSDIFKFFKNSNLIKMNYFIDSLIFKNENNKNNNKALKENKTSNILNENVNFYFNFNNFNFKKEFRPKF